MQGEAQKIDKIMEIFALEYFKNNKEEGAIKSEDSAYILSFAIMMLHTALHNPSVKHKTTKREWVSMNRGREAPLYCCVVHAVRGLFVSPPPTIHTHAHTHTHTHTYSLILQLFPTHDTTRHCPKCP